MVCVIDRGTVFEMVVFFLDSMLQLYIFIFCAFMQIQSLHLVIKTRGKWCEQWRLWIKGEGEMEISSLCLSVPQCLSLSCDECMCGVLKTHIFQCHMSLSASQIFYPLVSGRNSELTVHVLEWRLALLEFLRWCAGPVCYIFKGFLRPIFTMCYCHRMYWLHPLIPRWAVTPL